VHTPATRAGAADFSANRRHQAGAPRSRRFVNDDAKLEQFLANLMAMSPDERASVLFGRRCPRTGPFRVQEPWARRYSGAGCVVEFEQAEHRRAGHCQRSHRL